MPARSVLALYSLVAIFSAQSASCEEYWTLNSEQFQCILKNVDAYLGSDTDPVIIFVANCPETDIAKILADSSKNLLVVSPELKADSTESPAEVVMFTKEQLKCVSKNTFDTKSPTIRVPKNPCS